MSQTHCQWRPSMINYQGC